MKLFCFPPAAGGASLFRRWSSALAPQVELCAIQLPGRESRIREQPAVHMAALVDEISSDIAGLLGKSFGFYGHSMGALIAFEVAHAVREKTGRSPAHFFLSASRPPQDRQLVHRLHDLPDEEFLCEVQRYGLLPAHVLKCNELMQLLVPLLRADLRLCDEYRYCQRAPFTCPVTAIGCFDDPWVTAAELAAWEAHTAGRFELVMIAGGHQFHDESAEIFLNIIHNRLSPDEGRID
jgi:medium-chain acyl-[acyl-carrier-protein] hydrolase